MKNSLLFSAVIFGCAAIATASPARRVHKIVDLSANGRLSLSMHNGSITVTAWNQPRVEIDALIEPGHSDHPEDVDKVDIRVGGSSGSVRVETRYDALQSLRSNSWMSHNRSRPPVHYTISMPATASLELEDHNAVIRIEGLQSDVRITGHNGRVDISDFGGGAVINVHNASVRVAFRQLVRVSEIETHNGSIELRLPENARFNVNASGHRLSVDSDFPVVTKRLNRRTYVGNVNGGGPELRVSTHNGALRLKRT